MDSLWFMVLDAIAFGLACHVLSKLGHRFFTFPESFRDAAALNQCSRCRWYILKTYRKTSHSELHEQSSCLLLQSLSVAKAIQFRRPGPYSRTSLTSLTPQSRAVLSTPTNSPPAVDVLSKRVTLVQ